MREENTHRKIVHLDLDSFFVSVERLIDSKLHHKPVLIGGTGSRGVVASCSYEARKFGIHSAMPMQQAKRMCPEAVIIRGNSAVYSKYSDVVTEIIKESVPLFEKASIDEFYADLSGMDKFFGCQKFTDELRQKIIKESGLPISFGLSVNKTVSKVATGEAKPNNRIFINNGNEKHFLGPRSVKKLPGVGIQSYQSLCNLGVKQIKTMQQIPPELLQQIFGKNGVSMWKKANGIDPSPVKPYSERKSISTERTFAHDTSQKTKLESLLIAMTENLCYQLRRGNKLTGCISVKIRYADYQTQTVQKQVPYTSADHILIPCARDLFNKLFQRRVMVRLIGVRFSKLVSGGHQINMFEDSERIINLYKAMDGIREKYGDRAVIRASGKEGRTIGRPNPFNGSAPLLLANRHI